MIQREGMIVTTLSINNRTRVPQSLRAMPSPAEAPQVFAAFYAFANVLVHWVGTAYAPSSEHLYGWTAFWMACCFVCTRYSYPWPFVGSVMAGIGLQKNLGMLWGSYPFGGSQPGNELWLSWSARLSVTMLATSIAFYRTFTARWNRQT